MYAILGARQAASLSMRTKLLHVWPRHAQGVTEIQRVQSDTSNQIDPVTTRRAVPSLILTPGATAAHVWYLLGTSSRRPHERMCDGSQPLKLTSFLEDNAAG